MPCQQPLCTVLTAAQLAEGPLQQHTGGVELTIRRHHIRVVLRFCLCALLRCQLGAAVDGRHLCQYFAAR